MFSPNVFCPEGTVLKFPICRNVADCFFRVTASELHVQSAMQGTALSLVLRLRSMCFPLKCFLLNVP